jgi:uncharacterized protein YutE (UPF0331/DUF86 family)
MSPGKLDPQTMRRHLLALDRVLTQLGRHTGRPVLSLTEDLDERWAVERGLQLCTQSVLDIATHIVACAGHDAPDYASAMDELGRLGVLPVELAVKLRPLAGFRNALVQGYLAVDLARVHQVLNEKLDEVREFALCVDAYERILTVFGVAPVNQAVLQAAISLACPDFEEAVCAAAAEAAGCDASSRET